MAETMPCRSKNVGKDHDHAEFTAGREQSVPHSGRHSSNFSTTDRAQAHHALWCHHQAHMGAKHRAA